MDNQFSSDYHNFSQISSPTHRLPTVNGAEALFDTSRKSKPISTGLAALDATLSSTSDSLSSQGGIPCGHVTEVYGPPGCGKTHFAIQLAANTLSESNDTRVAWIDTSASLPYARLEQFLEAKNIKSDDSQSTGGKGKRGDQPLQYAERFDHFSITSFPHLLALLLSPAQEFPEEGTSLVVVDTLSHITMTGLPQTDNPAGPRAAMANGSLSREDIIARSIATRRSALLSAISTGLTHLAAARNIAIVVVNNTSSYRKSGSRHSILRSALNVPQWNENIATRIVLYRDFWPAVDWESLDPEERRKQRKRERWPLRVAAVEKVDGREVSAQGTRFVILKNHLHAVEPSKTITVTDVPRSSSPPIVGQDNEEAMGHLGIEDAVEVEDQGVRMPEDMPSSSVGGHKRTIEEVADSEDEEDLATGPGKKFPSTSRRHGGFLPSSQLAQDDDEDSGTSTTSRKPGEACDQAAESHDEDDDMLFHE